MSEGEASALTSAVGDRAGRAGRFDGDEIGAVVVLLVAAAAGGSWSSASIVLPYAARVVWWILYLVAVARLVQRSGAEWVVWMIRQQPALCLLLLSSLVSCSWSPDEALTLRRAISLLGTTLLGVLIGYRTRPERIVRVLAWTFTVLIASCAAVEIIWLTPVVEGVSWEGWRGFMVHKNSFGAAAMIASVFFLVMTLRRGIHPIWGVGLSLLSLVALVQARSRTSIAALVLGLAAWVYLTGAWSGERPGRAQSRRLLLALVLAASVLPFLIAPLSPVLGAHDPLNGRTHLWAGVATMLSERPATGYGYEVVWGRGEETFLPHIPVTARHWATSAHNSIVQIASELGIPAAIVACIYLFGALADAARLFEREPSAFSSFALVFVIGIALLGLTESHLLRIHSMIWILFVALTVAVRCALIRRDDAAPASRAHE